MAKFQSSSYTHFKVDTYQRFRTATIKNKEASHNDITSLSVKESRWFEFHTALSSVNNAKVFYLVFWHIGIAVVFDGQKVNVFIVMEISRSFKLLLNLAEYIP